MNRDYVLHYGLQHHTLYTMFLNYHTALWRSKQIYLPSSDSDTVTTSPHQLLLCSSGATDGLRALCMNGAAECVCVRDPAASRDAAAKLTDAKKLLQRDTQTFTAAMQTEQWGNLNEVRREMKQV